MKEGITIKIIKENLIMIIGVAVILLIIFLAFLARDTLGVSKNNLEKEARASQQIAEGDLVAMDVTGDLAALLFHDAEKQHHTFSLYENHKGFSFGYFLVYGGSQSEIDEGIKGISKDQKMALFSMNRKHVAKIVVDVESSEIDSNKPFVYVVPEGANRIRLFDNKGNELPIDGGIETLLFSTE